MMFALGVLGVLQVAWLPGWCVVRMARLDRFGPPLVLAFGLSHLFNYLLAQMLQPVGLYTRGPLLLVIAAEIAAAAWLGRAAWHRPVAAYGADAVAFLRRAAALGEGGWTRRVLLGLVAACLVVYWLAWVSELGRVFRGWDDVNAWNRWAVEWATGRFGAERGFYPHLLPVNWSVTYVLIGDASIEMFAKSIAAIYVPLTLHLLLWRAVRDGQWLALPGIVFLALMIPAMISVVFLYGYADVPAGFMGLLAVHLGLEARGRAAVPAEATQCLLWGAVFAAGAALNKPSGAVLALVFLAIVAPLGAARPRAMLAAAALMLMLAVPQYVSRAFEQASRLQGLSSDQRLLQLTGLGPGGQRDYVVKDIPTRLADAFAGLARPLVLDKLAARAPDGAARIVAEGLRAVFPMLAALAAAVILLALGDPVWRWALGLVLLPYVLIWALNFGYDNRNLVPMLPTFALCLQAGLSRIVSGWAWRRA